MANTVEPKNGQHSASVPSLVNRYFHHVTFTILGNFTSSPQCLGSSLPPSLFYAG